MGLGICVETDLGRNYKVPHGRTRTMKSVRGKIVALVIALSIAVCTGTSNVRAQQAGLGDEGPMDSEPGAKMVPMLSTFYGGDITFQGNQMDADIKDVVQDGKNFSGTWALAPDSMTVPTDVGPFKGKLATKGKIKVTMTLPLPNDSFPHCKVQLKGASTDDGFSFTGTARESKCGPDGKALGKGTFFLTAG